MKSLCISLPIWIGFFLGSFEGKALPHHGHYETPTDFQEFPSKPKVQQNKALALFKIWFAGDFDNSKHCQRDSSIAPSEIHIAQIWENYFTDGVWFYEETQAPQGILSSQKIYQIKEYAPARFELLVYTIKDFEGYAGGYSNSSLFENLSPEDLMEHSDCTVYLVRKGEGQFIGSTVKSDCELHRGVGQYTTFNLEVSPIRMNRANRVFGWENELLSGPALETKGIEYKRIVVKAPKAPKAPKPPKPVKESRPTPKGKAPKSTKKSKASKPTKESNPMPDNEQSQGG